MKILPKDYRNFVFKHLNTIHNDGVLAKKVIKEFKIDEARYHSVRRAVCLFRSQDKEERLKKENPGIVEACEALNINPKHSNLMWLKSKEASVMVKNPLFKAAGISEDEITAIMQSVIDSITISKDKFTPKNIVTSSNDKALKVTISDSHVGMDSNPNQDALFQYEYSKEIYEQSMERVFSSIVKEHKTHGIFEILYLDDMGDLADGYNGQTTRGGHALPQNMTNIEVFEACVNTKVKMIRSIVDGKIARKVVLRNVCNDNHAGSFGLIINKAIQMLVNVLYHNNFVEVDLLTRFIEHREYGDHCFILTHGKDQKHMFKGLPYVLDKKTESYLVDYIEHYKITSKFIHVEKGDLHQIGYQRVKRFDYRNFMSFAPPSSWVQHNFGDSYSGYSIQVIPKNTNEISHTDYFIDYKKI